MQDLPKDPAMLMSTLNMWLRDRYDCLEALCDDLGLDEQTLKATLAEAGFEYNDDLRKFW